MMCAAVFVITHVDKALYCMYVISCSQMGSGFVYATGQSFLNRHVLPCFLSLTIVINRYKWKDGCNPTLLAAYQWERSVIL